MSGVVMILRITVSFALAVDVVAVSVALAGAGTITFAPIVFLVTGAIALLLAMPAYLALRSVRRETWLSCMVAGFLVGALVAAFVSLPMSGSVQIGQEMTVVAGVRTAAGWRMYVEAVGVAGGIGAGAGCVFWAALRLLEHVVRWPRLEWLPLAAGLSLAIAASCTILAIPALTMDRSCHNVLRDGRQSIAPVLYFQVELAGGDWPRFQDAAERFAGVEGWNIDESNDKDKAFSWGRFVSACIEPGTEIRFNGVDKPDSTRAEISVFQPQGGKGWQQSAGRLLASLEERFPGRLRRNWSSKEAETPSTLLPSIE